ncbi:MAG: VPEID-CTERM sorting domain-containing protein [Paracoccaceae bacterium]
MKKLAFAAVATLAAIPAYAVGNCPPGQVCTAVPEISALEGTAAIAALAAIVLLAWERRRRAA